MIFDSALKTLEKRYGIPFQFVENYDGRPLDMSTYFDAAALALVAPLVASLLAMSVSEGRT